MTLATNPTLDDPAAVRAWLTERGICTRPVLALESAGPGNMNRVLRVRFDDGNTVIVKQALPWVAKYPDIPAPIERCEAEAAFYAAIREVPGLAERMPRVLHFDAADHVLVLEDLGAAADFSHLYASGRLDPERAAELLQWLAALHAAPIEPRHWPVLDNRAMRELNHAHIFEVPFADPPAVDLDALTAGLADAARALREDADLRDAAVSLGQMYLNASGPSLLHGDYYPGSWLTHPTRGALVIDPEFGFFGPPEFDLGVCHAHLLMAGADVSLLDGYRAPDGFDRARSGQFAGIEIIRRLLGVAQLPLSMDLTTRQALLSQARNLTVSGDVQ